jgi:hypothetical protein
MSTATSSKITHDDLLKMPEDNRLREIIDGELIVSPSPFVVHQRILRELARSIGNFLELYPIGELFVAPLDRCGEGIVVRATLTTPLLPGLEIDLAKVFAPR